MHGTLRTHIIIFADGPALALPQTEYRSLCYPNPPSWQSALLGPWSFGKTDYITRYSDLAIVPQSADYTYIPINKIP